jgi:hypothetical protein
MFILEPLLGRLLGYGTVAVSTLGGLQFPLRFIGKPHVFHAALQRAVADAKAPSRPPAKAAPAPLDYARYMQGPDATAFRVGDCSRSAPG